MKNLQTFEEFLNEAYWEVNADTTKVFQVKNDTEAQKLLSGKTVTTYRVEKDFEAKDVYGKDQTISRGTILDVYILINSGNLNMHNIYFDRKNNKYFPSDYRGEDQLQSFEDNTTNLR